MTHARNPFPAHLSRRISRRELLRAAGAGAGALALGPILAACTKSSTNGATTGFGGPPAGIVNFANWPLYIDSARDAQGRPYHPSLDAFTKDTGIQVNYRQVIEDAGTFLDSVQNWLAAGEPTGWDIMVITNGPTLTKMIELNYLMELPTDQRPNFDKYSGDKNPAYDPGNKYSMAWQSGITGIAYNPKLTRRPITDVHDLFDPAFKGRVGMFGDIVDLPNMGLLAAGIEPETSTEDDWRKAAALLTKQRSEGIVKGYYLQNYINALTNGDVALTMAWSGDIYQEQASGRASGLKFVAPPNSALLWTDNMVIPKGAQHPVDAMRLMDFVYRPDIAAMIAEWVAYISPVPSARDSVLQDAQSATGDEAATLEKLANSQLVFPTDTSHLHTYRELKTDEETSTWNRIFAPFQV